MYGESSKIERVEALESAMNENIGDRRFFSYIQLHEFEALLFSNNNGFAYYFQKNVLKEQVILFPRMKIQRI